MDKQDVFKRVDHTQLKAVATWLEIKTLCEEAMTLRMASVCIPPCYVERVRASYGNRLKICTVIGFPLGYHTTEVKIAETAQALADGADEIDMVVNLADVKNGDFDKVGKEISALKKLCGSRILKVIVEACYLSQEDKIALCRVVTEAEADYVKTSTGFGSGGATLEDVELFRTHIGEKVKIKAAGGVKTAEDLKKFIEAGCDRIGASSAITAFEAEQ